MDMPGETDVRCSTIFFRDEDLLLVHRARNGTDDWVLPGGTPHPGDRMAACARRETLEQTGVSMQPAGVAFVLESLRPGSARRTVDLAFLAHGFPGEQPEAMKLDLEARFVPLAVLSELQLRPPLAGYLRALHANGAWRTAAYLGNMWRPEPNGTVPVHSRPESAR